MNLASTRKQAAVVLVGAVVLAIAAWFLLVSPKRSEAATLETEIAAVHQEIVAARTANRAAQKASRELAPLFLLAKAMPEDADMAATVLELNRLSGATGLTFESIMPQAPVAGPGYRVVPIEVSFQGRFDAVSLFLRRIREQVAVHKGKLSAAGRLYTVRKISLEEGEGTLPQLSASLTLDAFFYGGGAPAAGSSGSTPAAPTDEGDLTAQGSS